MRYPYIIGILYTLSEIRPISFNPGDDIVRDGQRYLFERLLGRENIEWRVFKVTRPGQWFGGLPAGLQNMHPKKIWPVWPFLPVSHCLMIDCDYLINASGPRLGMGTRNHSLFEPWNLVLKRILRHRHSPQFINLAFGSNFKEIRRWDRPIASYLHRAFCRAHCAPALLNTCREELALNILRTSGIDAEQVLCPSLLARHYYGLEPSEEGEKYIAVNFHTSGNREYLKHHECDGHYMKVIAEFFEQLEKRGLAYRLIFHEPMELDLARKYYPIDIENRFILPRTVKEYLLAYGRAFVAVTSRVHGAYAAASFGVPSVCIGGDSRLKMVRALGLPALSCLSTDRGEIVSCMDQLIERRKHFNKSLLYQVSATEAQYLGLLAPILKDENKEHTTAS